MLLKTFFNSYKILEKLNKSDEINNKKDNNHRTICGLSKKTYDEIREYNKIVPTAKNYRSYKINIDKDGIYIEMMHPSKSLTFSILSECFNFQELPSKARDQIIKLSFKKEK